MPGQRSSFKNPALAVIHHHTLLVIAGFLLVFTLLRTLQIQVQGLLQVLNLHNLRASAITLHPESMQPLSLCLYRKLSLP